MGVWELEKIDLLLELKYYLEDAININIKFIEDHSPVATNDECTLMEVNNRIVDNTTLRWVISLINEKIGELNSG